MINKPNGYEEAEVYAEQQKLPAGGYIVKILDTRISAYDWGSVLLVNVDIAEGEYKDFFKNNYYNQNQENRKWKGILRINLPKDDGTEKDNWSVRALKTNMTAIEESNNNFVWDWDETKLKDKTVGALFGNNEYLFNGHSGFYTACRRFIEIEKIRGNDFTIPKDKPLKDKGAQSILENSGEISDDELPF